MSDKELIRELLQREWETIDAERRNLSKHFCTDCQRLLSKAQEIDVRGKRVQRELDELLGKSVTVPIATARTMEVISKPVERPNVLKLTHSFTKVGEWEDSSGVPRHYYKEIFQAVIKVMQGKGMMSRPEVGELLPFTSDAALLRAHLKSLVEDGVVIIHGSGPHTKYMLKPKKAEVQEKMDSGDIRAAGLEGRVS